MQTEMTFMRIETGWSAILAVVAAAWLALITYLAANGALQASPGTTPLGFLVAAGLPVALAAALYQISASFRTFVLSIHPIILTIAQSWRILGGLFLALLAFGQLPGFFAWPAGLGDMAVGLAAPIVVIALLRSDRFVTSGRYVAFHILGLFDFVVAFTTGILARGPLAGLVSEVTAAPMGELPLALIPGFLVPVFMLLHFAALAQVSHLRRR